MKILHVHPGSDTAGQSMAGKPFLEAAGDEVRVSVGSLHAFAYPGESSMFNAEAIQESYRWADVVVFHNDPALMFPKVANGPRRPELFVFHHGSQFRRHPERRWADGEAIGAQQIVSTVDLLLHVPPGKQAYWLPQVVDLDYMAEVRAATPPRPTDRLVVSHAPTNKGIKGTRFVRRAMRTIDADLVLILHKKWAECLAMKAASDVFVDQLLLGYGNNSIEAWAMGLPVVAGAPEPILARMRQEYRTKLPFVATTPLTVGQDIRSLLESADLRAEWAERGMKHVRRFHAPEPWVKRFHRILAGDAEKEEAA